MAFSVKEAACPSWTQQLPPAPAPRVPCRKPVHEQRDRIVDSQPVGSARCFGISQWIRPPSSRPSPPGEGEWFARFCEVIRQISSSVIRANRLPPQSQVVAADISPSPGGEGRGEGGRAIQYSRPRFGAWMLIFFMKPQSSPIHSCEFMHQMMP